MACHFPIGAFVWVSALLSLSLNAHSLQTPLDPCVSENHPRAFRWDQQGPDFITGE